MSKPKYKKGDRLIEDCGCEWIIVSAPRLGNSYVVRHLNDKDAFKWNYKDLEKHLTKKLDNENNR